MGRVVVGVDGSRVGQQALAFAADEARMRDAVLELVHVRPLTGPGGRAARSGSAHYASAEAFESLVEHDQERDEEDARHAREAAETLLHRALEDIDVSDVRVETTTLVDRRPARRLVELVNGNADVDLLVVGSRGLGELSGMLLGSVSQACVAHAHVPVTVVHRPPA
jgi:nucleotide-binding universal stress UspA family protein